jgi:hypothetical protein
VGLNAFVPRLAVPAACLILLAGLMIVLPVDVLSVRLPRQDQALFDAVQVTVGDDVRLQYRHSVEKTPVVGVFAIGPGPVLQARETRMTSVGTGLPNTRADDTRRDGQWLVVDEKLAAVDGFDFFISAVNATRLTVAGTEVAVGTLASGSVIRIDVLRIRLIDWIGWRYGRLDWRKDRQQ